MGGGKAKKEKSKPDKTPVDSKSSSKIIGKIKSAIKGSKEHLTNKINRSKEEEDGSETDVEVNDRSSKNDDSRRSRTSTANTDASSMDNSREEKPERKILTTKNVRDFENTDKAGVYHIMVRIIEGRDLPGINLLVRTSIDGRTKATRVSSEKEPHWRQNLSYTLDRSMEKMSDTVLDVKLYSESRIGRDHLHGEWSCFLGSILHQPDRCVASKWIALRKPREDTWSNSENVGFIRVSIAIFGDHETPPHMNDDNCEELFSGAQLLQFSLTLRLYRIHALAQCLADPFNESKFIGRNSTATPYYSIRVTLGEVSQECDCRLISMSDQLAVIELNQEIILPIMWPTVINSIQFALIISKGKKAKRIIARSSIQLSSIYEAGPDGYMPKFGPSYINLYGPQKIPRLKRRKEKHPKGNFDEHRYYCRLLLSIECSDQSIEKSFVDELSKNAHEYAKAFEKLYNYSLFCSFFDCSNIDPSFASSSISFAVSMGIFGSTQSTIMDERSSTFPMMPYFDGVKYYTLPWGNYKPVTYFKCQFDNVAFRVERTNAILKVVTVLSQYIDDCRVNSHESPEDICSIAIEGIEQTILMLDNLMVHHKANQMITSLDFDRYNARKNHIEQMKRELDGLKFEPVNQTETVAASIRILSRFREWVRRMATDDSASLPDVFIKMFANKKLVGIARIPAHKVFYSTHESRRGDFSGELHAYPIEWLTMNAQRKKNENVAGVIHARLWVGATTMEKYWHRLMEPAEQKAYLEIFQFQNKSLLSSQFKEDIFRDVSGQRDMLPFVRSPPKGWKYKGNWFVMNSHMLFMRADANRKSVVDKIFELEWKPTGDANDKWVFKKYSDYYGTPLNNSVLNEPVMKGWELVGDGKWITDRFAYGDKNGWSYSMNDCFWGDIEMRDDVEGKSHLFRRRCLTRLRQSKEYNRTGEDLEEYIRTLRPEEHWEYAADENSSFHDNMDDGDRVRRRRFLMEMVKDAKRDQDSSRIPRMYEYHLTSDRWELRAYILWGKELLRTDHARVFVRCTFICKGQETRIIKNSQQPIFNETLVFKDLLIPGSHNGMKENPPEILLEVKGEQVNDSEVFLGRCSVRPTVICNKTSPRGKLAWHTLHFSGQMTRGAILGCFELYRIPSSQNSKDCEIPPLPTIKRKTEDRERDRYEVPKDVLPEINKYSLQALFWGVRNLSKHQLLSVRRPMVELIAGDGDVDSGALEDYTKNPNFPEQFMLIDCVRLSTPLHFSPPLTLNLFDCRAFKRKPLVGTCYISDIKRYIHTVTKRESSSRRDFTEFDKFVADQEDLVGTEISRSKRYNADEDEDSLMSDCRVDWWSKYYYSLGMVEKAPGFEESGYDKVRVFDTDLEDVPEFHRFEDFLDTFKFRKVSSGQFDDAEQREVTGELKGKLFITKYVDGKPSLIDHPPGVEFVDPVECVVRVYVVEAQELLATRKNGIIDPYVEVRLGKQKMKLKKSYQADTAEPEFGEMVEFRTTIPMDKDLTINIMNKRTILADEEIGSTKIDLENRLLSKYRGMIGLAQEFIVKGELGWRDSQTPLKILLNYCKKMLLPAPEIIYKDGNSKKAIGIKMLGIPFMVKAFDKPKHPEIVGSDMQRVALFILHKIGLVPEHVETRKLTSHNHGTVVCGKLRCFVDIFPVSYGLIPPPLDISLREPQPYQLRVAIFHVLNAILTKRSFGKPSGDLYFKVFVNGMHKPQQTDIHYRVTDGYGSFNWRIVIDFDYNPWEKKVYMYEKKRLFKKAHKELVDPLVIVQLWDNNKFKKDGFIGEYTLNLFDIEFGRMSDGEIRDIDYAHEKKNCWCVVGCKFFCKAFIGMCCSCCKCCHQKKKGSQTLPLPRAPRYNRPAARPPKSMKKEEMDRGDSSSIRTSSKYDEETSLFDTYAIHGVWPMLSRTLKKEQMMEDSKKKKDDDYKGSEEEDDYVVGCVEMELQLLTKAEAELDPVGKKRNEPNQNPFLEKPDRSKWDSFWFTSRIKPAISFWWRKFGSKCVMITIMVVIAVLLFAALIWRLSDPVTWAEVISSIFK